MTKQSIIDKLWGQALDKAVPETYSSLTWTQVDKVKNVFVDLLVQECVKVINADIETQIKDGVISNVHGLNQARNLIVEHFGVE